MYLTKAEVADLLRVHEATVSRYIKKGLLRAVKNPGSNGHVRIEKASVDEYIAEHAVEVAG